MRINNNLMAMNTHRQLGLNNAAGAKSIEKLSSGYRINRAGDDAAGLSISEKMRAQIRGLNQASRNSQDSISLIQTAEGALNETQAILQRMRELAVQSSNDTNVTIDREAIQAEFSQLTSEINRIGETTEFNTLKLLDGSVSSTSRAQTSTVRTIAASGSYTANFAAGVTAVGGMADTDVINGGAIAIDNTNADLAGATGLVGSSESSITITRTNSTTFTVAIEVMQTSAVASYTSTETYSYAAGTDFSYDNHGISFTIDDADFSKFDANGEGLTVVFGATEVAAGTVGAANDWTTNTATAGASIAAGITVGPVASEIEDARSIDISRNSTTLTVNFKDSAGASISQDQILVTSGVYSYSQHGVSFDIDIIGTTAAATASMTINLDTTETTASSVVEDNSLVFQVGANESQVMGLSLSDMRAEALGISSSTAGVDGEAGFVATAEVTDGVSSTASEYALDVTSSSAAQAAITTINDALESVSAERAKLGAVQNRLEHTIKNLDTSSENLQASESRIRDVDMAKEMMEFTKNNILQQAAQAMLAQANQAPQGVLQLLR